MELKQLKYFIEVAKREHLSEAALELNIAQSAISRQIALLEEELGTALFQRIGRRIVLTDAGRQLLNEAHDILNKVDGTLRQFKHLADTRAQQLRIGYTQGYTSQILAMLIQTFEEQAHVDILPMRYADHTIAQALHNHDIDLALDTFDTVRYQDHLFTATPLFDETYHLYVNVHDPISLSTQPPLTQLKAKQWFAYDVPETMMTTILKKHVTMPIYTIDHPQLVKHILKQDKGIVMMPSYQMIEDSAHWRKISLAHTELKRTIYTIVKSDNALPHLNALQHMMQRMLSRTTSYF